MNRFSKWLCLTAVLFATSGVQADAIADLKAKLDAMKTQLDGIMNTLKNKIPTINLPNLANLTAVKNLLSTGMGAANLQGVAALNKMKDKLPPGAFGAFMTKLQDLKGNAVRLSGVMGKLKTIGGSVDSFDFSKFSKDKINALRTSVPNVGGAVIGAVANVKSQVTSGIDKLKGDALAKLNGVKDGITGMFSDMVGWVKKNTTPSKVWVLTLSGTKTGGVMDFANISSAEEKTLPPGTTDVASAIVAMGSSNKLPWPDSKDKLTDTLHSLRDAAKAAKSISEGKTQLQGVLDGDAVKFVTVDIKDLVDMLDSANAANLKKLGTKVGANYFVLSDAEVTAIKTDLGSIVDLLMALDETGEFTEAKATEMKNDLGGAIDAFNGAANSYNNYDKDTAEAKTSLSGVFGKDLTAAEAQDVFNKFKNTLMNVFGESEAVAAGK